MKNFKKPHMHSSGYEPVVISTQTQYDPNTDGINSNYGKTQRLKYGQVVGGDKNNKMIYGSFEPLAVDLKSLNSKHKNPPVKKFYQAPDHFCYGEKDFSQGDRISRNNKISNIFSLEERTSAEIRKKQKEVQDTEEDYHRYYQEKQRNRIRIEEEKRKDHELLATYKAPWGKAGGGAPKEQHNRTHAVNELLDDKDQTFPFGRPGGGAPLKTNSGNLRAGLPAAQEIRFQKRDRNQIYDVIEPEGKMHKRSPFETNLDILAHETREKRNVVRRNQDASSIVYDPFGRPGAGAPLRDDTGHTCATRSKNLLRTIEGKDDRVSQVDVGFYSGFGRSGGGAPIYGEDGIVQTSKKQTFVTAENGAVFKSESNESLDERGGGGAPVRDSNGKLVANFHHTWKEGEFFDPETKRKYLEELRLQAEEHDNMKKAEKNELIKPSVDTMSWIKQGKVGRPPIDEFTHEIKGAPRMTSDIVRQRLEIDTHRDKSKFKEYHDDLEKHSKHNEEIRQQQALQQRQQSAEHAETMNTVWGRPGNGAPNLSPRRRKHNDSSDVEVPYKRSNTIVEETVRSPLTISLPDRMVQEKTLRYVSHEQHENGKNVVQHIVAHQKISNPSKHAPFATELDEPCQSSIQPVIKCRNYSSERAQVTKHRAEDDNVPPPGKILLSNTVRKKLMLRQQQQHQCDDQIVRKNEKYQN